MSGSNCCFLTCVQISQEAGQVVWYSHLFKNFPQFVVIHTVKDFSVVKEAEIHVFLEFSCSFYEPTDVGNLISCSSAFSKSSLYMCSGSQFTHYIQRGHKEKWATEDVMVGWYHWLNGHEFEQTPRDSEGQGRPSCCSSQGWRVRHVLVTEQQQQCTRKNAAYFITGLTCSQTYSLQDVEKWEKFNCPVKNLSVCSCLSSGGDCVPKDDNNISHPINSWNVTWKTTLQEAESVSPLFKSQFTLWSVLTNRMEWKYSYLTFRGEL